MEFRAWARTSQRKTSDGRSSAHSFASTLVAMENSSEATLTSLSLPMLGRLVS